MIVTIVIVDDKTAGVLETEIRLDNLRWVILPVHLDRHDEYADFIWYLVVLNRVLRKCIEDGIKFLRILEGPAGEKAILFTGNIDDGLGGVRLDTGELDLRNEREAIAYLHGDQLIVVGGIRIHEFFSSRVGVTLTEPQKGSLKALTSWGLWYIPRRPSLVSGPL